MYTLKISSKEGERKTYYIIQIFIQIETPLKEIQVYLGSLLYFKNMLSSKIQAYMQILNKNCKAMAEWVLSPKAKEAFEMIQKSLKDDLQKVENIPNLLYNLY